MTFRTAVQRAEVQLGAHAVPSALHDARQLLSWVMGAEPLELVALDPDIPPESLARFERLVARRSLREPLQYILGEAWFMGLRFLARSNVLIVRIDTETVCQSALDVLKKGARVLDLCTGSGALAVAIKVLRADCEVCAADISPDALKLARDNAGLHNVEITFYEGDFFAPARGTFDLIVVNPPYIPTEDLKLLQEEVQREPMLALDGGTDGLSFYRRLFVEAPQYLNPGGYVVCELGDGQSDAVRALAARRFTGITLHNDLGGLPRALRARLKENFDG